MDIEILEEIKEHLATTIAKDKIEQNISLFQKVSPRIEDLILYSISPEKSLDLHLIKTNDIDKTIDIFQEMSRDNEALQNIDFESKRNKAIENQMFSVISEELSAAQNNQEVEQVIDYFQEVLNEMKIKNIDLNKLGQETKQDLGLNNQHHKISKKDNLPSVNGNDKKSINSNESRVVHRPKLMTTNVEQNVHTPTPTPIPKTPNNPKGRGA